MQNVTGDVGEVVVQARGEMGATERGYAHDKVDHLRNLASGPILFARVDLTAHADPARERPCFAKAEIDVNGQLVRAHAAAATMFEAIDQNTSGGTVKSRPRVPRTSHARPRSASSYGARRSR